MEIVVGVTFSKWRLLTEPSALVLVLRRQGLFTIELVNVERMQAMEASPSSSSPNIAIRSESTNYIAEEGALSLHVCML
jgi:hypothetical protein